MTQIKKTVTLKDVAALADVSAITVSRALRQPHKLSQATRDRVSAAISELGYVPDRAAAALASGRSAVIGLLVPSLTNNVFSPMLRGIYDVSGQSPYLIQMGNSRYSPSREEALIRSFLGQKPAAMIVAGIDQSPASRQLLQGAGIPVVQVIETTDDPIDLAIGFSQSRAAYAVADHLLAQGYQRPGFLGARMDPRARRRRDAFAQRLEAAGYYDPRRFVATAHPSSLAMGAQLFSDLLAAAPDTDAIFCNNDDLAAGAVFEAQRRQIRVPQDIGICGFNNHELSSQMNPPLTSVAVQLEEIGRRAMTMLLERLERPDQSVAPCNIDVGFELVARVSTTRPEPLRASP